MKPHVEHVCLENRIWLSAWVNPLPFFQVFRLTMTWGRRGGTTCLPPRNLEFLGSLSVGTPTASLESGES